MTQPHTSQLDYLKKDKLLYRVIQQLGPIPLQPTGDPFVHLIRTVAGQQLSVKAAASIFEKFSKLLPKPKPASVLALTIEELRSAGFSYGKASYIHNIAQFWTDKKITAKTFAQMDDEAVIEMLTEIKGVGRWSVEILLAFALGRPNVFFADDLGIQQGMCIIYGWDATDKKKLRQQMMEKAKSFAPYCTTVCLYIWKWKNLVKSGEAQPFAG
jgi:DNA-3-methyladenine glycosylase II